MRTTPKELYIINIMLIKLLRFVGAAIDLLQAGASLETIMLRGGWRSQDNAMNYLRSW